MRVPKLRDALIFSLALLSLLTSSAQGAEEAGRLPYDWYELPEDGAGNHSESSRGDVERDSVAGIIFRRGKAPIERTLNKIFATSAESMDQVKDYVGSRQKPANAPPNWVPWHLNEMLMDLGVNASGTLGLFTGKGALSTEVYWHRTALGRKSLGFSGSARSESAKESESANLALTDETTLLELERQINMITRAVMATGRVRNEGKVRQGLLKAAQELQSLMIDINTSNDTHWSVSRFRLQVSISASGTVATGVTAGGTLRLTFEWKKAASTSGSENFDFRESIKRNNLRRLLTAVARDMETVSSDIYQNSGFDLTTLRVGVGLYANANFGVVKGGIGVMGFAYFSKSRDLHKPTRHDDEDIVLSENIPLIDPIPKAEHISYARNNNIPFVASPNSSGSEKIIYFMSRKRFQKGLAGAARVGSIFAERAKHATLAAPDRKWAIDEIRSQFALSIEGAAPVVTIGGTVALQLTFKKS